MATSKNSQGMTIANSTYEKLDELKSDDETFDDIIRKLVDMDLKYNSKSEIFEYEFLTEGNSKVFRVKFEGNKHSVEYYSKKGFSKNISAWNEYLPISDYDKDLFIEFIVQEKSFNLLRDMGQSIEFNEFLIRRVG